MASSVEIVTAFWVASTRAERLQLTCIHVRKENQYRLAATIYRKAREAFESYDARGVGYADFLLSWSECSRSRALR